MAGGAVKGAYGDGDSFHIHSGSQGDDRAAVFRGCAGDRCQLRVQTQADYFKLTVQETLKLGEKAAEFTRKTLSGRFTVVTRQEDARGNSHEPRYYGFVLLEGRKKNFAEVRL